MTFTTGLNYFYLNVTLFVRVTTVSMDAVVLVMMRRQVECRPRLLRLRFPLALRAGVAVRLVRGRLRVRLRLPLRLRLRRPV